MHFNDHHVRLLSENDADALFYLIDRNRKRLEDFFAGTVAKTKNLEGTRNYVKEVMQRIESNTYFPFVVTGGDELMIGFVDVKNIDWNIPKGELGCFIDEAHAGKGVSFRALTAVVDWCFAEKGFRKLFLRTHQDNTAARKLAEKCGFEVEGIIRKDYKTTRGDLVDLVYYGRLA